MQINNQSPKEWSKHQTKDKILKIPTPSWRRQWVRNYTRNPNTKLALHIKNRSSSFVNFGLLSTSTTFSKFKVQVVGVLSLPKISNTTHPENPKLVIWVLNWLKQVRGSRLDANFFVLWHATYIDHKQYLCLDATTCRALAHRTGLLHLGADSTSANYQTK